MQNWDDLFGENIATFTAVFETWREKKAKEGKKTRVKKKKDQVFKGSLI